MMLSLNAFILKAAIQPKVNITASVTSLRVNNGPTLSLWTNHGLNKEEGNGLMTLQMFWSSATVTKFSMCHIKIDLSS